MRGEAGARGVIRQKRGILGGGCVLVVGWVGVCVGFGVGLGLD